MNYIFLLIPILILIYFYKKSERGIKICNKSIKKLIKQNYTLYGAKVVGVSYDNNDGSSRQNIINKYVEIDDCLGMKFYKYEGEIACAIYAKGHQIGNLSKSDAIYLYEHKENDINIYTRSVGLSESSGLLGVNIDIYLSLNKNKISNTAETSDFYDKPEETHKALKELDWTMERARSYGFSNKNIRFHNHQRIWIEKYSKLKNNDTSDGDSYYVYQYVVNDKVIYIGKGTTDYTISVKYSRAADIYNHETCRPFINDIKVIILKGFDNELDALQYEISLIKHYRIENLLNKRH